MNPAGSGGGSTLVALLSLETDMDTFVAELERGDNVLDAALRTEPNVAVLDVDLPGIDGLEAAKHLHERLPACQNLVLDRAQPTQASLL